MGLNFNTIIFDMDGTLTNPYKGIYNSLRYALSKMQYSKIPDTIPPGFIGPPLQQSFQKLFGFSSKQIDLVVKYFREYYGKYGLYENIPYNGITELLAALSSEGRKIFIATSKLEKYAWDIVRHFEFDRYIDDLQGADYAGNQSKEELIVCILNKYKIEKTNAIMVGDTIFDIQGAKKAGIQSIALGYGFGTEELLTKEDPDYYVDTVEELSELFFY